MLVSSDRRENFDFLISNIKAKDISKYRESLFVPRGNILSFFFILDLFLDSIYNSDFIYIYIILVPYGLLLKMASVGIWYSTVVLVFFAERKWNTVGNDPAYDNDIHTLFCCEYLSI